MSGQRTRSGSIFHEAVKLPTARRHLFGKDILQNAAFNKGLAFTEAERRLFRIEGLLPAVVLTQEIQVQRVMESLSKASDDLERYVKLLALANRNERLFYKVLTQYVEEMMPLVYTPTVGLACQRFGHIFRQPQGLYINLTHIGRVKSILQAWEQDVKVIVFTDGERILGLGDLGTYGMGIPIGKLMLYTALGGVDPQACLPVCIDSGTNNETLLEDSMYTGLRRPRERSALYDDLIQEFIDGARETWGENVLLQFEDFANQNAFRLLDKYQDYCCCFNDDIQGTASVVLGGIYAALKATKTTFDDHVFLFYGAGSAGIGIANLIAYAMSMDTGKTVEEARKQIWLIDSRGLIYKDRASGGIKDGKVAYAHELNETPASGELVDIVKCVKATGLFGVCAQPQVFNEAALKEMCNISAHPLVFALSNPTSKAECTAEQAYKFTDGKCYFASGSPFDPVEHNGRTHVPGQGNNSFIFPGVGLAAVVTKAERVNDKMFYLASKTLGNLVTEEDISVGLLYPRISVIREVCIKIAIEVTKMIFDEDLASIKKPKGNIESWVRSQVYVPDYRIYATETAML